MASFSNVLRSLRIQKHLTQLALADKIGVNKQTISQYERGVRQPDFEKLEALCDYFNVSTDYMLGKSEITMRFVTSEELALLNTNIRFIPVIDSITAADSKEGTAGIEKTANIEDYIVIPGSWEGDYGAFHVKGDSMLPVIREGDTVIFRRQNDAKSGDIVIAMTGTEGYTIKKYIKKGRKCILVPFNSDSKTPETDIYAGAAKPRILGKVVENRQKY